MNRQQILHHKESVGRHAINNTVKFRRSVAKVLDDVCDPAIYTEDLYAENLR